MPSRVIAQSIIPRTSPGARLVSLVSNWGLPSPASARGSAGTWPEVELGRSGRSDGRRRGRRSTAGRHRGAGRVARSRGTKVSSGSARCAQHRGGRGGGVEEVVGVGGAVTVTVDRVRRPRWRGRAASDRRPGRCRGRRRSCRWSVSADRPPRSPRSGGIDPTEMVDGRALVVAVAGADPARRRPARRRRACSPGGRRRLRRRRPGRRCRRRRGDPGLRCRRWPGRPSAPSRRRRRSPRRGPWWPTPSAFSRSLRALPARPSGRWWRAFWTSLARSSSSRRPDRARCIESLATLSSAPWRT